MDPRDVHQMLRLLLLPPPRSLCASTGHYPHLPSREHVQPTTARVPWCRDKFPGRMHGAPQAGATSCWPLLPQDPPDSVPLPPPSLSEPEPPIRYSFNPILSEHRTDALRWPTHRGRSISKAKPQELCEQRREREISPSSLRSGELYLHNQLDVPWICGIPE